VPISGPVRPLGEVFESAEAALPSPPRLSRPRHRGTTRFLAEVSWAVVGNVAARAASVVGLLILVRLVTPSEFGLFSLGWALYMVIGQLISGLDLGFIDLAVREKDPVNLERAYTQVKVLGVVILLLAWPFLLAGATFGPTALIDGGQASALFVGGLGGAGLVLIQSDLSIFRARRLFSAYAALLAGYNIAVLGVLAILMAIGQRSAPVLLGAYAIVGFPVAAILQFRRLTGSTPSSTLKKDLLRHSRLLLVSSVEFSLAYRAELLLAGTLLSTAALARYAAPLRFFSLFELAVATLATVLLPHTSAMSRDEARGYFRRSLGFGGFILVSGALASWKARFVVVLLLGERYRDAAGLIPLFALAAGLLALTSTLQLLLFTYRRAGFLALLNGVLLLTKVLATVVLVPRIGAAGAAWALVLGYASVAAVLGCLLGRLKPWTVST
jgi:O-antigen/teichoic acid export membrane protein